MAENKLAIDGGKAVRGEPMPVRGLIGVEEKAAAMAVFDEAIETGKVFVYNGAHEQQYEKDFVEFMGGGFADGVSSGTTAVYCALGALGLDALSEVIVPPITDPGGVMPVAMLCCVPVVADSAPDSYNTSAEQIEPLINERTRAIIVAHIAGEAADMYPIMELAKKHNLYVIEDCAQAHGAKYKGRLVGKFGHMAAFSTMPGKHHSTGCQGGLVYTQDEELHWKGKRFADRGKPLNLDSKGNVVAGLNCNLNDLAAAIGVAQLKKLPGVLQRRREIGEAIREGLKERKAICMAAQVADSESSYWFVRFRLDLDLLSVDKVRFCAALSAEGIPEVLASYRHIPCEAPWFKNKAVFGTTGFPWNCAEYKGDRDPVFKLDNVIEATDAGFIIIIHEKYGQKEVGDILGAIEKVEKAYLK